MPVVKAPYGKARVPAGNEGYISEALRGQMGPSEGMFTYPTGRSGQAIVTPVALDNVDCAMDIESSILDTKGWRGSPTNLKHSLKGASVEDDIGASGSVKKTLISNH